jgi:hypothetical protein
MSNNGRVIDKKAKRKTKYENKREIITRGVIIINIGVQSVVYPASINNSGT